MALTRGSAKHKPKTYKCGCGRVYTLQVIKEAKMEKCPYCERKIDEKV